MSMHGLAVTRHPVISVGTLLALHEQVKESAAGQQYRQRCIPDKGEPV
jgi:hypothetical protein